MTTLFVVGDILGFGGGAIVIGGSHDGRRWMKPVVRTDPANAAHASPLE